MAQPPWGFHYEETPADLPRFDMREEVFNDAEINARFDDVEKERAQITCGYCGARHRSGRTAAVNWFLRHECVDVTQQAIAA